MIYELINFFKTLAEFWFKNYNANECKISTLLSVLIEFPLAANSVA